MTIVVTGSSTGIGRQLVLRLLACGHRVCGLARSDQSELAQQWRDNFIGLPCDVAVWPQVEAAATRVASAWGAVDALVTCAAVHGEVGPAMACDAEAWTATIRTDLDGTFYAIRAFHGLLAEAPGRAKVVCFSGGGATKARPLFSAYGVAKTAVVRLVETIAEEERDGRLDINAVAPGAVTTRLTDEILALGPSGAGTDEYAAALRQKASGPGSLERALSLVDWLISPRSDGISGRLLSAPWDPWETLDSRAADLAGTDIYTLRRIIPKERGKSWG